jgi:hypothetical protein
MAVEKLRKNAPAVQASEAPAENAIVLLRFSSEKPAVRTHPELLYF